MKYMTHTLKIVRKTFKTFQQLNIEKEEERTPEFTVGIPFSD
jgi:hypothetical protein